jgi:hypothetical protein
MSDTPLGTDLDSRFVQQYRGDLYYIQVYMYSEVTGFEPLAVPITFIQALTIEESLMDWCVKGWIVLENDFEIFERGALSYKNSNYGLSKDSVDVTQQKAPLFFRTDGRNRISLKIYPIRTSQNDALGGGNLPSDLWEMSFDCVIYDIEDLPTNSARAKLRKFYFWDERYQILTERNIQWSTGLNSASLLQFNNAPQVFGEGNPSDIQRAMPASDAIKSIIQTAASNESDPASPVIKVGYTVGGSIDNPNIPLDSIDDANWDSGNTEETLIFYTSPAFSNAFQDINYVLENAKSSDNSPVFLRFGRWSEDKNWKLISLSKYIEESEKNQVERLILEDSVPPSVAPPYMPRAYDTASSDIQNFMSGIASVITTYRFSPMVATDDARLTNRPLYSYNFSTGEQQAWFESNTVQSTIDTTKTIAGKGLYAFKQSDHLLVSNSITKKQGLMVTPNLETQTFFNKDKPRIGMIKDILFLNESVFFKAPGLTIRAPGRFIWIDRITSSAETNPFDDRFLGQWMITNIKHFFGKDTYECDIVATKLDSFSKYGDDNTSMY